jgi:hypothetical protein
MSKLTPNSVCVCGHTKANHDQDKCNGISLIRNGAKALCGCKSFQEAVLYPVAHESSATKLRDFAQLERELAEAIRKAQTAETNWFDAKHEYGKNVSEFRRQLNEAERERDTYKQAALNRVDVAMLAKERDLARAELAALRARVTELEAATATLNERQRLEWSRAETAEAEVRRLREMNVYLTALLRQVMNKFVDEKEGDCLFCEREDGEHDEYCLGETIHDALGANAEAK